MITPTASPILQLSATSRSALQFSNPPEEPYEVYESQGETIVARLRELAEDETRADRTVRFTNSASDAESDIEFARRTR